MNRRKFLKNILIGASACVVPGAVLAKVKNNPLIDSNISYERLCNLINRKYMPVYYEYVFNTQYYILHLMKQSSKRYDKKINTLLNTNIFNA